jgi:hypothetical protein
MQNVMWFCRACGGLRRPAARNEVTWPRNEVTLPAAFRRGRSRGWASVGPVGLTTGRRAPSRAPRPLPSGRSTPPVRSNCRRAGSGYAKGMAGNGGSASCGGVCAGGMGVRIVCDGEVESGGSGCARKTAGSGGSHCAMGRRRTGVRIVRWGRGERVFALCDGEGENGRSHCAMPLAGNVDFRVNFGFGVVNFGIAKNCILD